ncbi:hydroxybutyrate dehydrogenase [Penicillium riverlandense]|uniref:hydroxybutyrate dehydrogenase n=1 Tax=Penicillium riverlandense TaxID=1903569 RepID=UPI0025470C9F|nr:hydroxybutyrate dehydrogenase [Penicillium riverlandense]KAJ5815280.1 hydroxybutyrate dehydrogenase [Penicillium riverlandense]
MSPPGSVLITGCSDGGVGSGLALVFQARGYHVFATTRSPEKMSTLKDLPNVTLLQLDVVDPSQIRAAVEAVTATTGGTLSVLINNAARFHLRPLLDDDLEAAKQTFETNVWGPLAVTKAFAPLLIQARGMLVNITTIAGHNPMPYSGVYGASKRAQEHMSDVFRLELAPFDVKVLSVVTGAVASGQGAQSVVLPSDSRYKAIEPIIAARGSNSHSRMPVVTYTTQVVDQIEAGTTGKVWLGNHAEEAKQATLNPEKAAEWVCLVCPGRGWC